MSKQSLKRKNRSLCHPRLPLFCFLVSGILLLTTSQPCRAERRYTLGAQLDLRGGASNYLADSSQSETYPEQKFSPYFSISPSVDFNSEGRNFDMQAVYGFSYNRYERDEPETIRSHTVNFRFNSNPGENVRLSITNRFNTNPDYITYELSKNLIVTDAGFGYIFVPTPSRQTFRTNNTRVKIDWGLSPQSYLTFIAGGNLRDYENSGDYSYYLRDQYRINGSAGFNYRSSEHTTWTIRYSIVRNHWQNYGYSLTHSALAGFSHRLRPSVVLSFEAGPSYVVNNAVNKNYLGYIGNFTITKSTEFTQILLYASHRSGDSSGIGYVSDTTRGGIRFSFRPHKYVNVALSSSAYRTRQRHDNPLNIWGFDGGGQIAWLINRYLRIGGGANYQKFEERVLYDREYKQIYGFISLTAPAFWDTKR